MARRLKTVPAAGIFTPSRTDEFLLAESNTTVNNLLGYQSGSYFTISKSNVAQNTSGGIRCFLIDFCVREGYRGSRGSSGSLSNARFPGVEVSDNQGTQAVTRNFASSTYNANMELYATVQVFGNFHGTVSFKFTAQRASANPAYNGGYFCNVQIIDGLNYGLRGFYIKGSNPRTLNTQYQSIANFYHNLTDFDTYDANIPRWQYGASMGASANSTQQYGSFGWGTYSLEDMRAYAAYYNHDETNYKGYDLQYLNGSGSTTSRETVAYYRKGGIATSTTPYMYNNSTRYFYFRRHNNGGVVLLTSGLLI